MPGQLLRNARFRSEIKGFCKKNSAKILDVLLFGSTVRQKEEPNDIDLLVIYKDKKDIDVSYKLKKLLKKIGLDAEITDKTYGEMINGSFKAAEAVLSEGYSMLYDKFLSAGLGYVNLALFKYDLGHLSKSDRMRFYYSLYGRTKTQVGILKEFDAVKFSDTVLLCPVENSEKMKDYFERWNIKIIDFPVLLPSRLGYVLGITV